MGSRHTKGPASPWYVVVGTLVGAIGLLTAACTTSDETTDTDAAYPASTEAGVEEIRFSSEGFELVGDLVLAVNRYAPCSSSAPRSPC